MQQAQIARNPFALMTDPEAIFAAIESSERLSRLHSRICRPLDRPLLGQAGEDLNAEGDGADAIEATDAADALLEDAGAAQTD